MTRGARISGLLVLIAAMVAQAQDTEFASDPSGNLMSLTAAVLAAPQILSQPQMQVVQPGELAAFFVIAADQRGLSYQWLFYGTNLPAATSDNLLVTNVSALNQGPYSVVLSNPSGSITSTVAQLYLDSRGVGMPDSWQLTFFGNLNQSPTGDFDADGVSNLQEFLDGTNPADRASARFRLSVLSAGAVVNQDPNRLSYTNGEVVTLTATAFAPYDFRAWGGDVVSTNNPVTVTMTNNKSVVAYAGPANIFWTNTASGDWNNPANWSPNLIPGTNDNVTINNAVTVTLGTSVECGGLILGTPGVLPTLAVSGSLTLDGLFYWYAGTLSGGGKTIISPPATLIIDNPSTVYLNSCTLENDGTILWPGANDISMNGTAAITNTPGALFLVQNAANLSGSGARFDNAGTFRKTSNLGTTQIPTAFNNFPAGIIEVQSGTLYFSGGVTQNGTLTLFPGTTNIIDGAGSAAGSFNVPAGALVTWTGNAFTSPFTLNPGVQLNGPGLYRIDGAKLYCNADLAVQNLELLLINGGAQSSLDGSGSVTISNTMNWLSGDMSDVGRTIIAPGATLNLPNPGTVFLNRTLENDGTILWTGAGIQMSGPVLSNAPGALFLAQNSANLTGSGVRFDNAGVFRKSTSPGTTQISPAFNNYAAIEVQSGTLALVSGTFLQNGVVNLSPGTTNIINTSGSATGSFNAPATAVVDWIGNGFIGPFTLNPGAKLNGNGLYRVDSARLYCNTDLTVQNFYLAGSLNGTGTFTIGTVMNWLSGDMSDVGRTVVAAGATLNLPNPGTIFLNRSLENDGTILWTGANMQMGGPITNAPGGLFLAQSSASLTGSGVRFDNAGIFRKSTTAGTTQISPAFNNYATIELQAGTLDFVSGSFLQNGVVTLSPGTTNIINTSGSATGTFNTPATSVVDWIGNGFIGPFTLNPGAQLNGAGLYRVDSARLYCNTDLTIQNFYLGGSLNGTGTLTIGSTANWLGGDMSDVGRTVIAPGATLNMAASGTLFLNRTLENAGTTRWTGSGIQLGGSVFTNRVGGVFEAQNAASFSGSGRLDNAGMFRKSVNTGTTTVAGFPLNNYGTLDIRIGILAVNSGLNSSATALLNCGLGGTTAGTTYGQLQVPAALTVNGNLSVDLLPGYNPAVNDAFTVVSAASRNNTFANFSYPSNRVTLTLSNAPTAVVLRVTDVSLIPQPVLLMPQLLGSNLLLSWTAISNVYYRVETNADAGSNNWGELSGNITTTSNTATMLDLPASGSRFYRVHVLP